MQKQRQLQSLKNEIEANRREIDKLKSQEENLSKLQDRIERDRRLTVRYLRELGEQEDSLRQGLAGRQVDLLFKEAEAKEAATRLKRDVVHFYKLRHVAGPELLFSSRSFGELFARSQYLVRMVYRERVELAALAEERMQINRAASNLEARRRAVAALQAEKRREERRLKAQGARTEARMVEVRDERTDREKHMRELEASQTAIRRMIERLERERAREKERGKAPSITGDLEADRGRLPWPAEGKVIAEFGFEVHPKYGTQVPRNGIDIEAEAGAPIRAVAAGVVEFVDWLPGYGRTVILNHGGGYYTLYAHASTTLVRRGERVAPGQEIARVGDTDSLSGPCLHFEIRAGEKALNPRGWLR